MFWTIQLTGVYADECLKQNGGTQIPCFVTKLPNGSEKGTFLAVDLGGTNCRVCSVELHGDSTYTMVQAKHVVPRNVMINASHEPLFDFIAEKIGEFLKEHPEADVRDDNGVKDRNDYRKLAFTFSFTYESISLREGIMLQWDKGWDIPDAIGRDPCTMLQEAIARLELPVDVSALTNDSVGTLMAQAYTSQWNVSPLIAAIFGTGTNAAYFERMENIKKLHDTKDYRGRCMVGSMVVNTEWGGWFDEDAKAIHTTAYDEDLDATTGSTGKQLLEKRVSALYLGELARLAILDLMQEQVFDMTVDQDITPLVTSYGLGAPFLSLLAADKSEDLQETIPHISSTLKAHNVSANDARALRLVSMAIVRRAARLSGAAIGAIIVQSGRLNRKSSVSKSGSVVYKDSVTEGSSRDSPSKLSKGLSAIGTVLRSLLCYMEKTSRPVYSSPDGDVTEVSDIEEDIIDIGVDGSLFERYPTFEEDIRGAIRDVPQIGVEGEARVKMGLAKDGSSVGAALVAQSVA